MASKVKLDYVSGEIAVRLDNLHPNPDNPRHEPGDIGELAASIREHGLLQSLLVRPAEQFGSGHYFIEAGWRRWTAMRLGTDHEEAPCRVWIGTASSNPRQHSVVVGVIENVHRANLDPIEKAQAFGKLHDEFGMTQNEIGKTVGLSGATVSEYMTLLELDEPSQERVRLGRVSVKDASAAVRKSRRQARRRKGQKPINIFWEPEHFTNKHPLAHNASAMCDARGHTQRRRLGKKGAFRGACGQCWETAIRSDQDIVGSVKKELGGADTAGRILTDAMGGNHR